MDLPKKAAYLKGLMEGLKIDTETPEGKLLAAIVDLLNDTADTVEDLADCIDAMSDELDAIEEDMEEIEDYILDEEEYDEDEDDYEDEAIYEVKCPTCGEVIDLDEEMLEKGSVICPQCGESLEFDDEGEEPEGKFCFKERITAAHDCEPPLSLLQSFFSASSKALAS